MSQMDSVDESSPKKPGAEEQAAEEKEDMQDIEEEIETDAEPVSAGSGSAKGSREEQEDAEGQEESASQVRSGLPCPCRALPASDAQPRHDPRHVAGRRMKSWWHHTAGACLVGGFMTGAQGRPPGPAAA